ncbi:diguanylate cyclase domain-containing protein [Gynuella sp.]|uniref:diguanylate cyclase domain-containing protein n=1 Tax=Gynuella sp. TaxID=2969146 RepID=UPI003D114DD0
MQKKLNNQLFALSGLGLVAGILLTQGISWITSAQKLAHMQILGFLCIGIAIILLTACFKLIAMVRLDISNQISAQLQQLLNKTNTILSASKKIKNDQQGLIRLLNETSEGAWLKNLDNEFIFANEHLGKLLNATPTALVNRDSSVVDSDFLHHLNQVDARVIASAETESIEIETGNQHRFVIRSTPILNANGKVSGTAATVSDITHLKTLRELQDKWQFIDPLTSLGNILMGQNWLKDALATRQQDEIVAVLMFEYENFAEISKQLGSMVVDLIVAETGNRITGLVGQEQLPIRVSGDQFGLLIRKISDPADILSLAEQIKQQLSEPLTVHETELSLTPRLGMARTPVHGDDPIQLLATAEQDMRA